MGGVTSIAMIKKFLLMAISLIAVGVAILQAADEDLTLNLEATFGARCYLESLTGWLGWRIHPELTFLFQTPAPFPVTVRFT